MTKRKKGATLVIVLFTSLAIALMLVSTIAAVGRYYYPIVRREKTLRKTINPDLYGSTEE